MENRRRQKWDHNKRSHNKKPPRGSWQPMVPAWEKQFCKVVGSMDWETFLQLKKFMHLYENVIDWNDSAGEVAFCNAKKRFWADINGLSCDTSLPDPDLYIDEINWDEDIDVELLSDLEREPVISKAEEDHEPVVIFGDSLLPENAYSLTGWGDNEENIQEVLATSHPANHIDSWEQNWGDNEEKIQEVQANSYPVNPVGSWEQNWGDNEQKIQEVPANSYPVNHVGSWEQNWGDNEQKIQKVPANSYPVNHVGSWEQNWGDNEQKIQKVPANSYPVNHVGSWEQNWDDNEENIKEVPANSYPANHVDSWEQNWDNSFSNGAATGWEDYGNNAWHFSDGHVPSGFATWEYGWNNDGNWNYANSNLNCEVVPDSKENKADEKHGRWNDLTPARVYAGGYISNHRTSVAKGNDCYWNNTLRNDERRHEVTYLGDQSAIDKRRISRKWNSYNSRAPVGHKAAIAVGQMRKH